MPGVRGCVGAWVRGCDKRAASGQHGAQSVSARVDSMELLLWTGTDTKSAGPKPLALLW